MDYASTITECTHTEVKRSSHRIGHRLDVTNILDGRGYKEFSIVGLTSVVHVTSPVRSLTLNRGHSKLEFVNKHRPDSVASKLMSDGSLRIE